MPFHESLRVPLFLLVTAAFIFVADDAMPPRDPTPPVEAPPAAEVPSSSLARYDEPATSRCATLRDVVGPDIVRVDAGRIYFLSEARGLVAFDVSDVDHPREIARESLVGEPIALFVRNSTAIAIVADWDSPGDSAAARRSLVRVFDLSGARAFSIREDHVLAGDVRGAFMIDDTLHVVRDEVSPGGEATIVLSAFTLAHGALVARPELRVAGASAALDVASGRLLLARRLAPSDVVGDVGSGLAAADADLDPSGLLTPGGTLKLRGFFAPGDGSLADGDRLTAVVTCSDPACAPRAPVFVEIVDTENIFAPKLVAEVEASALDGAPVTAFDGEHLLIAGNHGYAHADATTIVRIIDLGDRGEIVPRGTVVLRGSVSNLVLSGDHAFAVGSVGTPSTSVRVAVQEIDLSASHRPTVVGGVVFGADWTWSLAQETASALGLDEETSTVALPFRAFDQASQLLSGGVELLRRAPGRMWRIASVPLADAPERLLFIDDRVVAVGAAGVSVVANDSDGRPRVVWPKPPRASDGRASLDRAH